MTSVRCETERTLLLHEMSPLQGDLKRRSKSQKDALKESILEEGLLAPFFVWRGKAEGEDGERNWLLDGHARKEALEGLAEDDPSIWEEEFPVVFVEAEDIASAKKALLQITSQYGNVTKAGALGFCESIPGYRAPSVSKFFKAASPIPERAIEVRDMPSTSPAVSDSEVKITIAVPKAYEKAVRDLFNSVSYIKVL